MAVLVGIDEAGFGPLLGPLVVTGVAYRVPDEMVGQSLWKVLANSCTREMGKKKRRLPITDSKKLHKSGAGMAALEKSALVSLAAAGHRPATFDELLGLVSPDAAEKFGGYAWYAPKNISLPATQECGDIGTQANGLRLDLSQNNITPLGVFSEPLPEGHYNQLVGRIRNKSVVLTGLVLRIIDRAIRAASKGKWRDERVYINVDRLGGRTFYREPLTRAFADFELQILEENEKRSAYELQRRPKRVNIEFAKESDNLHFLVSLASIYSKYIREIAMSGFNRYWCDAQPGLKPTAGYYQDAQRWLSDADETIGRLETDRSRLIRER